MMIPEYIDEFSVGEQRVPIEWRPLLYKRLMWEVHLVIWKLEIGQGSLGRRLALGAKEAQVDLGPLSH